MLKYAKICRSAEGITMYRVHTLKGIKTVKPHIIL